MLISFIVPPASFTISIPAAISHKFNFIMKKPSNLPDPTYAKSRAAQPEFLIFKSGYIIFIPLWSDENKQSSNHFF